MNDETIFEIDIPVSRLNMQIIALNDALNGKKDNMYLEGVLHALFPFDKYSEYYKDKQIFLVQFIEIKEDGIYLKFKFGKPKYDS